MAKALREAGGWCLDKKALPPGRLRLASLMAIKPTVWMGLNAHPAKCKEAVLRACDAAGA